MSDDLSPVRHSTSRRGRRATADIGVALLVLVLFPVAAAPQSSADARRPHTQTGSAGPRGLENDTLTMEIFNLRREDLQWRIRGPVPAATRHRLATAHDLALRKLKEESACKALFGQLGAVGEDVLKDVWYHDATETSHCQGAVRAFMCVGCREISLCPSFANLNVSAAALIVLHEALHAAGLPESPAYPDAPTARQINEMVIQGCRLY